VFQRELFGTPAAVGGVNAPRGMDVDPSTGRLFVDDWWNQRIDGFNADGTNPTSFGFRGNKNVVGSINFAWDVAVQPGTGRIFVANRESNEIKVFDQNGTQITHWGESGTASNVSPPQMKLPQGLAFAPDGTLWVSDTTNHRIQQFSIDPNGNPTWLATYGGPGAPGCGNGNGASANLGCFNTPTGIDIAADGTVWVADTNNNRIVKRDPVTGVWTGYIKPVGGTVFRIPWGVTVAPDGSIWVSDTGVDRIVKMDVNANQYFTFTGTDIGMPTNLDGPFDVAFGLNGRVWVSDTWNNRIVELGWP
jgi:tripartite motif-containing protein 71